MTADEFRQCRDKLGLSLTGMASALGVSRRAVQYYQSGERAIPKPIEKLCEALLGN